MLTNVYLFCLALGFVFTVGGAILGQFGGSNHGGDAGGHGPDVSHDYGAAGSHAGAGDADGSGHGGSLHLPLLSPTVLSCFVASFGGAGLVFERLVGSERAWLHGSLAAASSAFVGVALAWFIARITRGLEANRLARETDALGLLAEVTVSVPERGLGEIAYVSAGTRQTLSARSLDGKLHRQGASVRVVRLADGVAEVASEPSPALPSGLEGPSRGEPVDQRIGSKR